MPKNRFLTLPLCLALAFSASADHHVSDASTTDTDSTAALFTATFLGNYDYTTGHIIQLAEAIPADKYGWAPAEGVRSVEKAILHIVAANYMLGSKLGAELPENIDPMSIETEEHSKESSTEILKASIKFARNAVKAFPADQLGTEIELFGMQMNNLSVILIIGSHANEHLGQLIAYARSVDVTPPWSE